MPRDNKIDYIEFNATDIAATKIFYSEVFGWKFTDYGPDYSRLKMGELPGDSRKGTVAPAGTLIVIYVDDLAAAESSCQTVRRKNHEGDLLRSREDHDFILAIRTGMSWRFGTRSEAQVGSEI